MKLTSRINSNDEVVVMSEEERTQPQNRALAVARLKALVARALHVPKKRGATEPTLASNYVDSNPNTTFAGESGRTWC